MLKIFDVIFFLTIIITLFSTIFQNKSNFQSYLNLFSSIYISLRLYLSYQFTVHLVLAYSSIALFEPSKLFKHFLKR